LTDFVFPIYLFKYKRVSVLIPVVDNPVSVMLRRFSLKKILLLPLLFFLSCQVKNPILIGLSANLTGKFSDVGIDFRDGASMATEEINAQGGIQGKKIQLLIEDDQGDTHNALEADARLIQKGVPVILGHVLSSLTLAALPQVNEKKVLLINFTSMADELSEQDDYLIRFVGDIRGLVKEYALFALKKIPMNRTALVFDLSNEKYSRAWERVFSDTLKTHRKKIVYTKGLDFRQKVSYQELAREMILTRPEAILLVMASADTALMVQNIRKENPWIPILISSWPVTDDLEKNAGEALKNTYLISPNYDRDGKTPAFLNFKKRFRERFGREVSYGSFSGYQAVFFVAETLKTLKNPTPDAIKAAILAKKEFQGLQGVIRINEYGDTVSRPVFFRYDGGRYQIEKEFDPEKK